MSLSHDFLVCSLPDHTDFYEELLFYRTNREHAIQVRDKWMLKYWERFNCVPAYWDGIFERKHGLNYYGFSLVLAQDVPELLNSINALPHRVPFRYLCAMCNDAIAEGRGILHMGI